MKVFYEVWDPPELGCFYFQGRRTYEDMSWVIGWAINEALSRVISGAIRGLSKYLLRPLITPLTTRLRALYPDI